MKIINVGLSPWALESPVVQVEGEVMDYQCRFLNVDTVANSSVKVYKDRSDVTATVLPTLPTTSLFDNSAGRGVTVNQLQLLTGGKRYVIAITATVNGQVVVKKLEVICHKASQER